MSTVSQVLAEKGSEIWSVAPHQTVFEAIQVMAIRRVGALLVMDGEQLAGVVSERDYAREVILKGRSSKETPVKDIMTSEVVTASPQQQVDEVLSLMSQRRIRHLPVVVGGKVAGVISIGDLVKAVIREQQSTIEQLESYIKG